STFSQWVLVSAQRPRVEVNSVRKSAYHGTGGGSNVSAQLSKQVRWTHTPMPTRSPLSHSGWRLAGSRSAADVEPPQIGHRSVCRQIRAANCGGSTESVADTG